MQIRKVIIWIIIMLAVYSCAVFYALRDRGEPAVDVLAVNDMVQSLAEGWDVLEMLDLPGSEYGMDYVVLDNNDNLIRATRSGLNEDIGSAISNHDIIIDIKLDHEVLGKLIVYDDTKDTWDQYRIYLLIYSEITILFVAAFCLLFILFINRRIFRPFRKLQGFARNVAAGNLDMPIEMDKGNIFGAFSEGFDLMRDELKKSRENERVANQSKKELVASLSHDIKTPVASIMAVTDVMYAKSKDETNQKQLKIISAKAEQINTLITNMFNATLEEMKELVVTVTEQSSRIIYDLIKNADYNNCVTYAGKAECIVIMDELRLAQVIDNIISNSYKYAGTSIEVSIQIQGEFLILAFKDFGLGVSEDEEPLIFNKFYRAKNSEGISGTGLGLYISKYLMNKMSGDIDCEKTGDGFVVRIKLLIA